MALPSVQELLSHTPISLIRVLGTERTILSPFTKEYRALGTLTGIPLFLDCPSRGPSIQTQPGNHEYITQEHPVMLVSVN
jgi:hypothetical protein